MCYTCSRQFGIVEKGKLPPRIVADPPSFLAESVRMGRKVRGSLALRVKDSLTANRLIPNLILCG